MEEKKRYTAEDIEALTKKPYEELTPEERRLVNLRPWAKGQSGNPKGGQPNRIQWASHFKRLMNDKRFLKTIVSNHPQQWRDIVGETSAEVIAGALIGNVLKLAAKSLKDDKPLDKDTRELIALLNKLGYGDKVVHEVEDGFFDKAVINFNVVEPKSDGTEYNDK